MGVFYDLYYEKLIFPTKQISLNLFNYVWNYVQYFNNERIEVDPVIAQNYAIITFDC